MKFSDLVNKLENAVTNTSLSINDNDPNIAGVAAIDKATLNQLSYAEIGKYAARVADTQASALILPANEPIQATATQRGIAWIEVPHPRLAFAHAIALFYQPFKPSPSIHPSAVIDPSVHLGQRVAIGAHVVIGAGVTMGDDVIIHPNVVIYPDSQIGDRTVLHANCSIHERTQIGADCVIHCGAVIGSEGFGFVPTREGWLKMEQSGYTVLEDGVEIGANSNVDRPAVGETRVGRHTKIDNLVQIGHGCQIGQGCAFAAHVGLAGGTTIGNRVILAGQVGIGNEATVGDGAIVSAKAGVLRDVPPGQTVSGYPAMDHKTFLKSSAIYSRLSDLHQAIRQLQKRLDGK
ncbi:UDP-3-O-(3-hydroxymyristoyl)glucosamine N-acyltransferase [Myxacorys almedinensis]|uniref:UDP-3-O-acylglucosamine N-acyltransferase n=1 Tax=Myxacorys almedinensis A TaxID=2690445 RepID=A0A8J8CLP6_9CYAN|nr:UDP-3-O-(3-hydroxymyristoyl)glucosamine N-acyltransferase [Myxacorys almedinensis]NDJ16352.1 UDP-3-O-(3-hydroxymyristoyl)glucosamine N-acyltransferase [Myxacorys almedinensis A]